ncbi:hypothetical protein [Winogradskyella sp. PG-2]|uniref:hypothetical protein n=1 Tax=Winogradskyella sp. PG-2 TaxID=754409 RepID=UPI0004589870|nr:hypothetical protein [Winogradskyella sp. PG-2]BAO77682.1 hypothetical protein WPG_3452 [Winogradskyella sp. PG-2]
MKTYKIIPLFICLFLAFSCEDVLSCIIPREPELPNKEFPIGSTESFYYTEFDAEINNEPRDNDYDYFFYAEGLPLGMDYYVSHRTISFEGKPEETGTFRIKVFLDVEGPFRNNFDDDPDLLCEYSTSRSYKLIIE